MNDPAAGNEARFELLSAIPSHERDRARTQSALWGFGKRSAESSRSKPTDLRHTGRWRGRDGSDEEAGCSAVTAWAGSVGLGASLGWQRGEGIDALAVRAMSKAISTAMRASTAISGSSIARGLELGLAGLDRGAQRI